VIHEMDKKSMSGVRRGLFALQLVTAILLLSFSAASGQQEELFLARKLYADGMYKLALAQLDKYFSETLGEKPSSEALFIQGSSYYELKNWERAVESFTKLIQEYPGFPGLCGVSMKRARALFQLERTKEARRAFQFVWKTFQDCDEAKPARLMEAECLILEGKRTKARELLDDLELRVAGGELLAGVYYFKARILEDEGDRENAIAYYAKAATAMPESEPGSRAFLRRAALLEEQGALEEALEDLAKLTEATSDTGFLRQAIYKKAGLLLRLGRFDRAAELFGLFLKNYPASPESEDAQFQEARALYSAGRLHEASSVLAELRRRPAKEGSYDRVLFQSALVEKALRRVESANRFFREAFVVTSADSIAYRSIREVSSNLAAAGDYAGAEQTYLSGLAKVGEDSLRAKLWGELGDVYSRMRDYTEASKCFRRAFDTSRHRLRKELYLVKLIDSSIAASDWEEAIVACNDYLALSRDRSMRERIERKRRYVRDFMQTDPEAALAGFERVLEGKEAGWRKEFALGEIYASELKQYGKALRHYEKALACQGSDSACVAFRLGKVHFLLGQDYAPGNEDEHSRHLRKSVGWFDLAGTKGKSSWAEKALLERIGARVALEGESPTGPMAKSLYEEYLGMFPRGESAARAHLALGNILSSSARASADSLWPKAIVHYQKAIEYGADRDFRARARYGMASALLGARDSTRAVRFFEASLKGRLPDAERRTALHKLGELKLLRRKFTEAMENYRMLWRSFPYSVEGEKALTRIGDIFFLRGSIDSARTYYGAFLSAYPESPFRDDVRWRIISCYGREGDRKAEKKEIESFLAAFPKSSLRIKAYLKLGVIYRLEHRLDEATALYRSALSERPALDEKFLLEKALAGVRFAAGDYSEAAELYRRLMASSKGTEREFYWKQLIVCRLREGKLKPARAEMKRFRKARPKKRNLMNELAAEEAYAQYRSGNAARARKLLESLLKEDLDPGVAARVHFLLAMTHYRAGEFPEAKSEFTQAVELGLADSTALAYSKIGSSNYMLEDYEGAVRNYTEALKVSEEPDFRATTLFNLAVSYSAMDNWEEAARTYRRLLLEYPQSKEASEALVNLGYSYQKRGRFPDAIDVYEKARELSDSEDAARAQFWIGECHAAMGRLEDAALEFLKVSYLYPEEHMWAVTGQHRAAEMYERMGKISEAVRIYRSIVEKEGKGSDYGKPAYEKLKKLEAASGKQESEE